ncbi:MAG: CAP domain-containing protein [Ignavibacteriaceae bacterium]|nr:CAP domain-containing protein [Ignavibacteriaceae bacterium]
MKNKLMKFSFLLLPILFFAFSCEDDPVASNNINGSPSDSVEAEVHRLVNEHRTGMGLQRLEWNDIIANECRKHSQNLANSHTLNHDGFNERINKIGETISWSWAGENVAYNYSAQSVVTAWLNSPGHKSNIESNSNLTGVGVAYDGEHDLFHSDFY